MKIGLNLIHALPEIGGGWNYITSLIEALQKCDTGIRFVAFVNRESEMLIHDGSEIEKVVVNTTPGSRYQRVLYENTVLQIQARNHHIDLMHWFANTQALVNTAPAAVTIYDLQPFKKHADYSLLKSVYLGSMFPRTLSKARLLLPISGSVAGEISEHFNVSRDRIAVIPPIIKSSFHPASGTEIENLKEKYSLPDKFWIYVAHLYPHKNHIRLLAAYRGLRDGGFSPWALVFRGDPKAGESGFRKKVKELGLEGDIQVLPKLADQELPALYSAAAAMVYPSMYEGAGIPVIEAMACGCPIAAADIAAVKENAADAAVYFDPKNTGEIMNAMKQLQQSSEIRQSLVEKGHERARSFGPERIVDILLEAYRKAGSMRRQ